MSDTGLRTLFEELLLDEPSPTPPVAEDLARGRRARVRRRRRRLKGASIAVAVTAASALVVPISPVSIVDGDSALAPTTGGAADVPPEVGSDPMTLALWHAVADALPGDVHIEQEDVGATDGGLHMPLLRDGLSFSLTVSLQEARPDLDEFRPCSDPGPAADFYVQSNCEEERDADGRWRVMAEALGGHLGVAILEGGPASVTLRWDRVGYPPPICEGNVCEASSEDDAELTGNLTIAEGAAIAEAAWSVGTSYSLDNLATGIDLQATLDQWPDVVEGLASALALGDLDQAEPDSVVADIDGHVGSIIGSYTTADGDTVNVLVWQKERLYDPFCVAWMCNFLPGQSVFTDEAPDSGDTERASLGSIIGFGERAGAEIWIDSSDSAADQGLADATAEFEHLVPHLDDLQ